MIRKTRQGRLKESYAWRCADGDRALLCAWLRASSCEELTASHLTNRGVSRLAFRQTAPASACEIFVILRVDRTSAYLTKQIPGGQAWRWDAAAKDSFTQVEAEWRRDCGHVWAFDNRKTGIRQQTTEKAKRKLAEMHIPPGSLESSDNPVSLNQSSALVALQDPASAHQAPLGPNASFFTTVEEAPLGYSTSVGLVGPRAPHGTGNCTGTCTSETETTLHNYESFLLPCIRAPDWTQEAAYMSRGGQSLNCCLRWAHELVEAASDTPLALDPAPDPRYDPWSGNLLQSFTDDPNRDPEGGERLLHAQGLGMRRIALRQRQADGSTRPTCEHHLSHRALQLAVSEPRGRERLAAARGTHQVRVTGYAPVS